MRSCPVNIRCGASMKACTLLCLPASVWSVCQITRRGATIAQWRYADPFVAMAVTLAALVNVTRDMDSINDGLPYQKYSLPESHSEMITRFSRSSYARELLGDELYEGILEKYGKTKKRER